MHLQWDQQKYTTGFAHIDDQHREMFDGLNNLIFFLKNESITNTPEHKGKVIEMLEFLGKYTGRHFRDEEEIFEKYNHPMTAANKEAHQAFIEKYGQYQDKLATGKFTRGLLIQIHIFLRSWLINHILKIDTALCDCAEKAAEEQQNKKETFMEKRGVFSRFFDFSKKPERPYRLRAHTMSSPVPSGK